MFVGHYSASFVAKTLDPKIPLWLLFIAAQFVDIFWALFILTGVEKVSLDPTLPSNPLVLYFMPYTHSLLASVCWALLAFVLVRFVLVKFVSLKAASAKVSQTLKFSTYSSAIVAETVLSHWFVDVPVHRQDLVLMPGTKVGFGLWNYPIPAFLCEIILLAAAVLLYLKKACPPDQKRLVLVYLAVLCGIQLGTSFGPVPPSAAAIAAITLTLYVVLAAGAKFVEKPGLK